MDHLERLLHVARATVTASILNEKRLSRLKTRLPAHAHAHALTHSHAQSPTTSPTTSTSHAHAHPASTDPYPAPHQQSQSQSQKPIRRAKRTEQERIDYLANDPQVARFEAYRVLCAACDKWIRLRPNSTYCSIPWDAHRRSCLKKKARSVPPAFYSVLCVLCSTD